MSKEPAVIIAAVEAIIVAAMAFGLDISPEQLGAVVMALTAVGALIVRSKVSPVEV